MTKSNYLQLAMMATSIETIVPPKRFLYNVYRKHISWAQSIDCLPRNAYIVRPASRVFVQNSVCRPFPGRVCCTYGSYQHHHHHPDGNQSKDTRYTLNSMYSWGSVFGCLLYHRARSDTLRSHVCNIHMHVYILVGGWRVFIGHIDRSTDRPVR